MIPVELRPIVETLLAKARKNEVNWMAAADLDLGNDENDVVVSFPEHSINIFSAIDEDGEPIVGFSIINSLGKRVHGFTLLESDRDFKIVSELLSFATKKLSGVEEAISKLSEQMRVPGVVGRPRAQR